NTYWGKEFYGVAPFFHYSKNFSFYGPFWLRGGCYRVFPLIKAAPDGGYCWPAYWNKENGKLRSWGIFPILHWGSRWKYIFPSLTYSSPGYWEVTYVFPFFLFSRDSGNIIGPVWWYRNYSDKNLVWGVAPLWYWRSPEKHFFIPFYYKGKDEFYSLLYSRKNSIDRQIISILGPVYWKSTEPKREYTLAGGVFYKAEERKMKLYHILDHVKKDNFNDYRLLVDLFCRDYGLETVKDHSGFMELKKELSNLISGREYGIFPLFHKKISQEEDEFDILKILYRSGKVKKVLTTPLWGKGTVRNRTYHSSPLLLTFYEKRFGREEFLSLPLLTAVHKKYLTHPADELRPLVYTGMRYNGKFSGNFFRLNCNDHLKRYGVQLPESIEDAAQLRFYLEYLKYSGRIPAELRSSGHGFLPLYFYEGGEDGNAFYLNCLLSGWGENPRRKFFYCLPFLSWQYHDKNNHKTTKSILFPLYMERGAKRQKVQVLEKEVLREEKFHAAQEYVIYNFAGILASYRKGRFYLPRQQGKGAALDKLLRQLEVYENRNRTYKTNTKIAGKRAGFLRQAAEITGVELPDLKDLKALEASSEPLLQEFGKLSLSNLKLKKEIEKLDSELKADLAVFNIKWQGNTQKAREELLKKHIYLAGTSQFNSVIFNSFSALDHRKWSVLCFLLRGEKSAEKEHFSILEFLFRYRREGERSSLSFFPFVTVNEDEKGSEWSFLYRGLHFRNENGKRSGHILFIPFGKK
ncbi:MAG: hypothetical protein IKA87_02440, partial [Lentisphaeria bacterium]|nr:hypothetical protein [Lentisphaeria bacterium]